MFKRILVANRGEIAVRIITACKEMQIETVAIYSKADKDALHVKLADRAICIGSEKSENSYLNMGSIISAACITGCDAIHPGFGFLSENPRFANMVIKCGLVWIGPNPDVMQMLGNKSEAISIAKEAGIPIVPGSYGMVSKEDGLKLAKEIGFPILIKASAGGGGKGIRLVENEEQFVPLYNEAREEALKFFASDELYIEKYIKNPKHIEVQIMADKYQNVVHLFERNCSMQRRKQKLLEECPSVGLSDELKQNLYNSAVKLAKFVKYDSVGTVEFLVSGGDYYFIEMNTRIQVEHSITEEVTGIDIVKSMIEIAASKKLHLTQNDIKANGYAIECRINAEDIRHDFQPKCGKIEFIHYIGGKGIRIDSAIYSGYEITPYYDSMILKLIVHEKSREEAIKKMKVALEGLIIEGVPTTSEFFYMIMHHPKYILGDITTSFVDDTIKEFKANGRLI